MSDHQITIVSWIVYVLMYSSIFCLHRQQCLICIDLSKLMHKNLWEELTTRIHTYVRTYVHAVTCMSDYRRGLDWWMDLLTTYTYDSELQAITAPPLISTIHKSSQHPLSHFLACCVLISRSLAAAATSGDSSAFRALVLTSQRTVQNWTILNWLCPLLITSWHGPHRNTPFPLL
jgi:hypothetical protein